MSKIIDALKPLAVDIDELTLDGKNPRKGDVAAVAASLDKFGQHRPLVASRDGRVLIGNHTLLAAKKLGWTEIAVAYVDDNEQMAQARALADNRTHDLGGYDQGTLDSLLAELSSAPDLLLSAGFSQKEIEKAIAGGVIPVDGEKPKAPPSKAKVGDVKFTISEPEYRAFVAYLGAYREAHGTTDGVLGSLIARATGQSTAI